MKVRLGRLLVALSAASAAALIGAGAAQATTVGDCRVEGLSPAEPRYTLTNTSKDSAARAMMVCRTPHAVEVDLSLWGSDTVGHDLLRTTRTTRQVRAGNSYFEGPRAGCKEDFYGKDEVYTKVRARIAPPPGTAPGGVSVWSGWSAWDYGRVASLDCR
jgi:hypothetical protein